MTPNPPTPVAPSSEAAPVVRLARTAGVLIALLLGTFLALTKEPATTEAAERAEGNDAAALAVATGELVARTVDDDRVERATGGYVPTVGVVVTAQVNTLAGDELDGWIADLLGDQHSIAASLADDEQVILLLDVAKPDRVSRLIAVDPGEIVTTGTVTRMEAPATSTMPEIPSFAPAEATEPAASTDAAPESDESVGSADADQTESDEG